MGTHLLAPVFAALAWASLPNSSPTELPGSAESAAAGAAAGAPRAPEDPPEWRDNRRPELRSHWDRLEGKPAPSLAGLTEWYGRDAVDWKELRGKVVLIDYWATWCGPCRAGIPHLRRLQERHAQDGLVVLGVHSARGWEKMRGFADSNQLNYTLAADKGRSLAKALGVQFLPTYFAIDRSGTVRVAGADRAQLDSIVAALLAEKAPRGASVGEATKGDAGWPGTGPEKLYAKDLRGERFPALEALAWRGDAEPELEGKVVVYDLWATWCGPCVRGIPKLSELQDRFPNEVVIVGVSDESMKVVDRFLDKLAEKDDVRATYPMAVDGGKLAKQLAVQAIPHAVVVDSAGVVRWQGSPNAKGHKLDAELLGAIVEADRANRDGQPGGR